MNSLLPYPPDSHIVFHSRDRVWLCLSTLYHRRFVEDAIHIAGLPEGAHVRLRYGRAYVDEALWKALTEESADPRARILFALAATSERGENTILPLRAGRIVRASTQGSVLVIDMALEAFLYQPVPTGAFCEEISQISTGLPSDFRGKATGTFVQQLSSTPQALVGGTSVGAWERAAAAFFDIDTVRAAGNNSNKPTIDFLYYLANLAHAMTPDGHLEVEAGSALTFDVHTLISPTTRAILNPLGEVCCEISHSAASFISSRHVRIDSRRDIRTVRLSTTSLFRRKYGHLSIRTVTFRYAPTKSSDGADIPQSTAVDFAAAEERNESVIARYDFPLAIGKWMPWFAAVFVALAGAVASFKIPKEHADLELYKPVVVFFFALIGLFCGFRREGKSE